MTTCSLSSSRSDVVACMAASATAARSFPFVSAYMGVPSSAAPIPTLGHEFLGCQKTPRGHRDAIAAAAIGHERGSDIETIRVQASRLDGGSAFAARRRAARRVQARRLPGEGSHDTNQLSPTDRDGLRLDRRPPGRLESSKSRPTTRSPAAFDPRLGTARVAATLAETTAPSPRERRTILSAGESLRFLHGFQPGRPRRGRLRGPASAGEPVRTATRSGRRRPPARFAGSEPRATRHRATAGPERAAGRSPILAELPGTGDVLAGSASSTSWGAGRSPGSTWPRRSTWGAAGRHQGLAGRRGRAADPRPAPAHPHRAGPFGLRRPESGLRVICMPYFGGANLAQVLDAAGGLTTTGRGGRSLVERSTSQSAQSAPRASAGVRRRPSARRPARRRRRSAAGSSRPMSCSRPRTCRLERLDPRLRASARLLSRIIGGGAMASDAGRPAPGDDPHQPARQFLREATPSRPPSGSSPGWPRGSTTPTRGACSTAT